MAPKAQRLDTGYERFTRLDSVVERLLDIGFQVQWQSGREPKGPFVYFFPEDYTITQRPDPRISNKVEYEVNGITSCHAYSTCPEPATSHGLKYCPLHLHKFQQAWYGQATTQGGYKTSMLARAEVNFALPDAVREPNKHKVCKEMLKGIVQAADMGKLWATDCEAFMSVPSPFAVAPWEIAIANVTNMETQAYAAVIDYSGSLEDVAADIASYSHSTTIPKLCKIARRIYGANARDTSSGKLQQAGDGQTTVL
jgi:hypothetical protein